MPLALESQGRVRSKAREFIKNPGVFYTIKEFFLYLSIYKKDQDLQLLPFSPAQTVAVGGTALMDVPATLYAVWSKKQNTDVDAYLWVIDDAANDAGLATDGRVLIPNLTVSPSGVGTGTVGDEQVFYSPNGVPMAAGVVVASNTTPATTTPTNSALADAPLGFVIVGA